MKIHFTRSAVTIAAVVLLGVFFRFYDLGGKLVWHDEVATRVLAAGNTMAELRSDTYTGQVLDVSEVVKFEHLNPERGVLDTIEDLARHDPQHPPLYYLLARLWVRCFGDGIAVLRSLSVLCSLLCLGATFWFLMELSGSARVAWTGVMLGAISPLFVLYAQEAREYALWCAAILSSNAALLRAIRLTGKEAPWRRLAGAWAAYSLFTVLALYTSFSSASMILAQILYIIVRERGRPTAIAMMCAASLLLSALLFLPWALNLARNFEAFRASMAWASIIVIPRMALIRILSVNISRTVIDFWPDVEQESAPALAAAALVTALVGYAMIAIIRRTPRQTSLLILFLIVVPIAFLIVPDLLFGGIRSIVSRYMMASWIGVGAALAMLLGRDGNRGRDGILAILLLGGLASDVSNARQAAPWPKGVSVLLPEVARQINRSQAPLVVGDAERHHPGNLFALAGLLNPGAKMQLLAIGMEEGWVIPPGSSDIFLFSPRNEFRHQLEVREHAHTRLIAGDLFLELWQVERDDPP